MFRTKIPSPSYTHSYVNHNLFWSDFSCLKLTTIGIRDSLLKKKLLDPEPYEISGCELEPQARKTLSNKGSRDGVPKRSRLNRELGV